jgi:hypothetical protein
MKGAILFCGYRLIQRTWLLAFSHSAHSTFRFCAPLLRFCSLQRLRYQEPVFPRFSMPGTVRSCAFSSLQRFALPVTFRVYFTPKHSWDFPTELSPLKDWYLLLRRFLVIRRPLPLYRWLLRTPDARWLSIPGDKISVAGRF